ncbi:uncharacterized protein LOC117175004 [Belonocnema kinseyi]|uniref:uncharacterized protein LOC117175004 n=1 Tax=Belonocnema kinseyi TaxID=2817044 RepID=UPI00143DC385|nr:uncharacterized protein LOC117175004 [Belonocnema kinseyi]
MSGDDILLPLAIEKWPILAETLKKDWPFYAQYYYFVQTAIKWKSKEPVLPQKIYCPGGDHNSGIFVAISCFAVYNVLLFAHEGFETLLHKAVTETKIIQWTEGVCFPAVNSRIIPTVYSIIETLKQTKGIEIEWKLPGNCFFKSREKCAAVEVRVPEGCHLGRIDESHVPLIHSLWPHRNKEHPEQTTKFIMTMVRLNGGCGLFSRENNELLSWASQSELGALSFVQTIEKCKRKGYAKVVVNAFAKELAENGVDSFLYIIKENLVSETMFQSLDWKLNHEEEWIKMTETRNKIDLKN